MRVKRHLCCLAAASLLLASSGAALYVSARRAFSQGDLIVFDDGLASGWQNWSWGGSYDLAHGVTVYQGSSSISATITSPYGGLSLRVDPGLTGASYGAIQFWAHGGASGMRQLQVVVEEGDSGPRTAAFDIDVPAGGWQQFTVPLSALGNPATIKRINIEDRTGAGQPTFYVDEIKLLAATPPPPPPAGCDLPIYLDGLASGWQNWSWGGTYQLFHNATVYHGNFAIEASIGPGYGGLSFRVDPGITGGYTSILFWAHGGASGTRQLQVVVEQGDSGPRTSPYFIDVPAGTWTQFLIPLSALGNPTTIKRVNIEDRTGAGQPTFYVDAVCLSTAAPPPTPTPAPPPPDCDTPAYLDALAPGWQSWSWDGTYDFAHTTTVYQGSASIEATITNGYGGISLRVDPGLSSASYTSIRFWVHGGASSTRNLQVVVQQADVGQDTVPFAFDAPAGAWTQVIVPLSALGNPATIKRINIQDRTGAGQPTFYVDVVCLSAAPLPPPPPPPPSPPPPAPTPPPAPPASRFPGMPGCAYTLYDDALADGWEDWSWNTNVAREHPYSLQGRALAFQYRGGYAGLSLRTPVALSRSDYDAVSFWISGGEDPGVRQIVFLVQSSDEGGESRRFHIDVSPRTWTPVTIPFRLLGYVPAIKRINFQERTGQAQPPIFVDNICFLRDSGGVDLSGLADLRPGDLLLFDEATVDFVDDWSWETALSFANVQPAIGLRSLAVRHQKAYAGLSLRLKQARSAAEFSGIQFSIHGGDQGRRQLELYVQQADEGQESRRVKFDVPAGRWYDVSIPLSALGDLQTIKRINIQDRSGRPQAYYLDNIVLVGGNERVTLKLPASPSAAAAAPDVRPALRQVGQPWPDGVVYQDALAPGWENWSWETRVNFANAQPALGQRSIAASYAQGYAGLSLRAPMTLTAGDYSAIVFWVHGGETGERQLQFFVQQTDTGGESRRIPIEAPAGVWTPFTIPLTFLGELSTIKRLNLQDVSGAPQPTFYVDQIQLTREVVTTTLPPPRTGPTPEGGFLVYRDGYLAEGWDNWSWDTTVDFRNRAPTLFGSRSMMVRHRAAGGLSLRAPITLNAENYGGVLIRVLGGETRPRRLQLFVQTTDVGGEMPSFIFDVTPRRWLTFSIPFSALGNPRMIKRINIQDLSGALETTYYIDELAILPFRSRPEPPRSPHAVLFGNILAKGWRVTSQGMQLSFREERVARGMYAIAARITQPGARVQLETAQPVDAREFQTLSFWVHGGAQGMRGLKARIHSTADTVPVEVTFDAPANAWQEVRVALRSMPALRAIEIQTPANVTDGVFYLDDLRLMRD